MVWLGAVMGLMVVFCAAGEAQDKGQWRAASSNARAITGDVVITESKIVDGALAYRIQTPIVQTCQNSNQVNTQKMMLTALVLRTNAEDHLDGLAIDQLVAVVQ